ncbi:prepilin-type N-terminal cleavage/methylation domain-containing protein [Mobilitalea sibirica]|uniref:Prepilin-type N-terminal cleavage/methylation domain-containing protein n=1 Tax=Mobilitalea sibirica TaxID=1462919 RepID=A0A8J7GXC7_9FIRM|nr:prepilin-type N-terminal cleavage/methylation domain-containing protein [Mobilitalea sibirica]MBH1939789.1 prepilin-type N-terminal cleavage/methylation domain-containing protein [Mobilitalea sibirica]
MHLCKNNKGTSLIELIIAMAIAAIVLSLIMFFIKGSTQTFRRTSDEVNLQLEAQTTINQLSNIAMEAKSFTPISLTEERFIFRYNDNEYYSIIFNNGERRIYLVQTTTRSDAETIAPNMQEHFMAEYVESLTMVSSINGKMITINLQLSLGNEEHVISKKVKLRNAN